MTVYPYEPPEREYADTILAFQDFQMAGTWSVRVENDPLGPVNKIVTLMRGQRRIKSVLAHVRAGAKVQLVRDEGGYRIEDVFALQDLHWRNTEYGTKTATVHVPFRQPGWRVEVDDNTVLAVTDGEMQPPRTTPPVPWHRRTYRALKGALTQQVRADLDKLAGRLGYHRDDECGGDW